MHFDGKRDLEITRNYESSKASLKGILRRDDIRTRQRSCKSYRIVTIQQAGE
jgi:hypothetical protein